MSSDTKDSQPQPTTKYSRKKDGRFQLGIVPANKSPSHRPEMVGSQFGWVVIISPGVRWRKGNREMRVRCRGCRTEKWINLDNLISGKTNGCQACSQPRRIPKWLDRRMTAAKQRCTNPDSSSFKDYGGRGIRFEFESVLAAGLWIKEHLGLQRGLEIDRIDNSKGYAPGNLRYATRSEQSINSRLSRGVRYRGEVIPKLHAIHLFRVDHPEVKYADNTLQNLIGRYTEAQIVRRWNSRSCKPKGVYGTCLTPDPAIVSLYRGC